MHYLPVRFLKSILNSRKEAKALNLFFRQKQVNQKNGSNNIYKIPNITSQWKLYQGLKQQG